MIVPTKLINKIKPLRLPIYKRKKVLTFGVNQRQLHCINCEQFQIEMLVLFDFEKCRHCPTCQTSRCEIRKKLVEKKSLEFLKPKG